MSHVKMYTTAVCPYCVRAKQILKARGVTEIEEIRIDTQPEARAHMMNITGRRTVPQIFIGETHVGGCDDLIALDAKGGLVPPPCIGDNQPSLRAGAFSSGLEKITFKQEFLCQKQAPLCSKSSAFT